VWRGNLTTEIAGRDSSLAQQVDELYQLAQADQAELRITPQLLALTGSIGVCPVPRELHRGSIGKAHHQGGLPSRQDLELATLQRMVTADDGDLGRSV
jgi:hypothetical protein